MTPFERGLVAHLVADWVLQNDWMARNKTSLRHPAAWIHAGIQGLCLALALGWQAGVTLGFLHLLIDTRVPVLWWIRVFKKCGQAPEVTWIAIWLDQTLHIDCLALWLALAVLESSRMEKCLEEGIIKIPENHTLSLTQ